MDVLQPTLVWIEGRCYRKFLVEQNSSTAPYQEEDEYNSSTVAYNEADDEPEREPEYPIDEMGDGRFKTTVHVATTYFGHIIGTKGATKKRIENETKTRVTVPAFGKTGDILITGTNRESVRSARSRVELLVHNARRRQPFTHFLSLPLAGGVRDGFLDFKEAVFNECHGSRGLDASLFQNPDKLHLTLGTLVLQDDQERKLAAEILQECREEVVERILRKRSLAVRAQGVEYMNDDPAEVDVLYAVVQSVDGSNSLQQVADSVVARFAQSDLMQLQYDRVKLHATVINTLFRQHGAGAMDNELHEGVNRPRESFDGHTVLQRFADYKFGDYRIPSIQISERYSTAKDTGYYACSAKLDLP